MHDGRGGGEGMMAGQATLEYGYNAAVWAASYVKSAAVASYNAGRQAYTVSSNAAKFYGSTAILNGIKWYGKARTMAKYWFSVIDLSTKKSIGAGVIEGVVKSFDFMPPDLPYFIDNPFYKLGSDAVSSFINIVKKVFE